MEEMDPAACLKGWEWGLDFDFQNWQETYFKKKKWLQNQELT